LLRACDSQTNFRDILSKAFFLSRSQICRPDCVVGMGATKQFSRGTKPFSSWAADVPKPALAIHLSTTRRAALPNWRRQMRTISFILAFAFILAGPSMAGSIEGNLPGIGTFAFTGSPVISAAAPMVVAYAR
jgi:hypothetical protein